MKRQWALRPNLVDCILEQRIAPAILNLPVIALTTSGLVLVTPFPGASNSAAGSLGSGSTGSSTAPSVSGAAMPTSFYITGTRGISSFTPGNFTGNPSVGGGTSAGAVGAVAVTITVGSGADVAGAPITPTVSRSTVASGGENAPIMAYIGQPSSGSDTPTLPEGQSYRAPTAPVPALPPLGLVLPATSTGTSAGSTMGANPMNPLNPQIGLPSPGVGFRGPASSPAPVPVGNLPMLPNY